jgi:phosphoribosylformylglycinamidine cyclo-ligase
LGGTIGEAMLIPTRIYVKPVLNLLEKVAVKGIVHITGGGFYENIPRVLPPGTRASIERGSWTVPPLFSLLQEQGNILEREMFTTFNMGIGMVLVLDAGQEEAARQALSEYSIQPFRIGIIEACDEPPHVVLQS